MKNLLVTGALGFIGSNFVNYMISKNLNISKIVVLDKKDYCSSLSNLVKHPKIKLVIGDIRNSELVSYILENFQVDTVVHFAANSHVDNSFLNSVSFSENNTVGTHILLECCKQHQEKTSLISKFIHISTDEVYGEVDDGDMKFENSVLDPTNPYAASKAGAEFIAKSYFYSYKLPIIITRGNNVYGPQQYPEKIVPKFICQLLNNKKMTIHGNGQTKRNFIYVDDVCTAIETIIEKGEIGNIYNISSSYDNEYTVIDIAKMLTSLIYGDNEPLDQHITYVDDRKFNDYRYCISSDRLSELGWFPKFTNIKENLIKLINWYKNNTKSYFPNFSLV